MAKQPFSPKPRPNVLDTFAGVVGMVGGLFSKRPDRVLDESDVSEPISYGWLKKRGRLKLWQKRLSPHVCLCRRTCVCVIDGMNE